MKLSLVQFIAFCFIVGWVGGEAIGLDYDEKWWLAGSTAIGQAYLHNAHGKAWQYIKTFTSRLLTS